MADYNRHLLKKTLFCKEFIKMNTVGGYVQNESAGMNEAELEIRALINTASALNFVKENWDENRAVHKTVFWYLMQARSMDTVPQKEEGFIDAKFIHLDRVVDLAKYDDEKEIIKVALQEIKKRLKKN